MKTSFLKSLSVVALLTTTTPVMAADPVVAIVDGQKFTYSQVMEAKASLPKQYQSAPDDKIFPVLVNQAVDTYLINKAAQASGEAEKPEVKKAIAKQTEELIAQSYLFDKVKGTITDAAVQAKYDEFVKSFPQEKEVHLRHILVENKDTAMSVIKALKGGSDFKKLAQAKSKDATAKEGGDLGFFRKSELPKELADAAFALTPGSYSQEPVKTDFGWHVLKVEEIRDAKPPKFDEVKNELKALMTQEAVIALIKELRSQAQVELFDKDGKPMPKESEKKGEPVAPAAAPAGETPKAESAAEAPKPGAAPAEKK
ncbi:MAG: peptidyl-prolyl cis-trans isomerase [Alphaproteobacteria bacterium]|nr:peptidyl-prolyl cis-trans isomerase [Alphaproteobacteria bacterium]